MSEVEIDLRYLQLETVRNLVFLSKKNYPGGSFCDGFVVNILSRISVKLVHIVNIQSFNFVQEEIYVFMLLQASWSKTIFIMLEYAWCACVVLPNYCLGTDTTKLWRSRVINYNVMQNVWKFAKGHCCTFGTNFQVPWREAKRVIGACITVSDAWILVNNSTKFPKNQNQKLFWAFMLFILQYNNKYLQLKFIASKNIRTLS